MVTLTVRSVPDETRAALAEMAQARGQSLQAYLLATLEREARFRDNLRLISEIRADLSAGGGAGPDAPDAADVIRRERKRADPR
ncbi:MAG: FitA-like ribbon-helix-helix domain-containing protein [Ornithinimicrobium sp.]|uniref:FitA-like ribbon-helix-helix domain-containing protein n=1 Tax=Ornithinimicrobium sp. TaxID=1977084 RepID=UPI003D9BF37F